MKSTIFDAMLQTPKQGKDNNAEWSNPELAINKRSKGVIKQIVYIIIPCWEAGRHLETEDCQVSPHLNTLLKNSLCFYKQLETIFEKQSTTHH